MAQRVPLGVDNDPEMGRNYLLLPVHDGKPKIFLHIDGRVYSRRYATDPADGRNRYGVYCAASRYVVDKDGRTTVDVVCNGTPANPCGHVPTPVMHQFHRALRAARLLVCDLVDRGAIPPTPSKALVVGVLTLVFRAYAPNYPGLDVRRIYDVRNRAFRYIFEQDEAPRQPWAVPRGADPADLQVEIAHERTRGPAFGEAYEAVTARYPVPEVVVEGGEPEFQDAGPALDEVFAALRAQSRAVGLPIASITIEYQEPQGGRRLKRHALPPE